MDTKLKPRQEVITPERARELLKGNTHNRLVRNAHVDFLASEIAGGRWVVQGDSIKIAPDGTVVDGQHRLLAIIQANAAIETFVIYDYPLALQPSIDIGGSIRTVPDQLGLSEGLPNKQLAVAAARQIASICCYFQGPKLSVGTALMIIQEYNRELDYVIAACKGFKPGLRGWVIGSLVLAMKADRQLTSFIDAFGSGENLRSGDPALAARQWLLNGKTEALGASYKRAAIEGIFNAAYNALTGERISKIKRGERGLEHFMGKNRKSVATIRETFRHQISAIKPKG